MRYLYLIATALLLSACGGSETDGNRPNGDAAPESGLTTAQLEDGIGPVTSISLSGIDAALAAQGESVFTMKCSACHKMADRYVGPALGDVTTLRSPAYIMNMILNPEEMIQKHPEARKLLGQYMTPMPNQHLTEAEARAVLEFLRTQAQ